MAVSRREPLGLGIGFGLGIGAHAAWVRQDRRPRGAALSRRQADLAGAYDVVVIGSGYGASVVAARLAGARKVAVLERGREWSPGEFPSSLMDVMGSMRSALSPLGLLDLNANAFGDLDVVAANGLGGTSLLNAAISTRPLPPVFQEGAWPEALREEALRGASAEAPLGELEPFYAMAEEMLGAASDAVTDSLPKVRSLRESLVARGIPVGTLRLNIAREARERFGVRQSACRLCGDCCAGCNYGAKNTLTTSYLPYARAQGAELYCGIEVRTLEKTPAGRWIVHYLAHPLAGGIPRFGRVEARTVVLGAGSMGSTEILLRSRASGLALSQALGTRLSGNGDVLGFAYNGRSATNVVGFGREAGGREPVGHVISSYGDYRQDVPGKRLERQFLLLEGAIASALAPSIAAGFAQHARLGLADFTAEQWARVARDEASGAGPLPADGALNHSTVFLACGHDSSGGTYGLDLGGGLRAMWPDMAREPFFEEIHREMRWHADHAGALFVPNPRTTLFDGRLMATHPLGGCPMGDSEASGVVDDGGRVFDPAGGAHAGLYVVDGAAIPRSLGATPLLTITALAERSAAGMIRDGA